MEKPTVKTVDDLILEFDEATLQGSVPARFDQVVQRFGERPALIHDTEQMIYAELSATVNQIANWCLAQD